ncbi:histidine--tRNA ligase [Candidatus Amesbacteria bacterium RIFCSPLOWO2_01_FULL_49_25]|uniref:Histidine--tRNA ligase n=1 Tax=Candidatus Amesbacteria bacterium RIFCSPHIGHO2_01_FULL_48_32b TaxID=1797253 RepID=A0A1F4YD23_9BACT|nr:MAG: histidine--tRNA ligase [Candidatus Amesbacteria bacterium RIFCSPHIGHO2_01_FULL_48_32b]OGD07615.1 MAG: histidine--tRNA ligase [Candidatus Amesbacteria bacterium RIFCSPLOWO2_01_FULL_49_25]
MTTPQTLKGFRDFLPETMTIRNKVISTLKAVFESYGFAELQTPTLEYAEVLTGKYGEEAEKLMYLFKDPGNRAVGLKYDLTVPLARLMTQYPDLPKPFKRYQIQPAFRAENTQKSRYREFYQCDIDTIGTTSPLADAEILAVISDSLSALKFSDFTIRVNSRQILFDLIIKSGISSDKTFTVLQIIDKLDKKPRTEIEVELASKQVDQLQINNLFSLLDTAQPDPKLQEIIDLGIKLGARNVQFSPFLVRGLDYYTGAIFETIVEKPKIGSITGGGRYDQLIKTLGGPDLPAVGTTIGLDRICDVIADLNLWPNLPKSPAQVLVAIFSPDLYSPALKLSRSLRESGVNTELYPNPNIKLDKQLKYASAKNIPFIAILGPEEISQNSIKIKNMQTSEQQNLSLENLKNYLEIRN